MNDATEGASAERGTPTNEQVPPPERFLSIGNEGGRLVRGEAGDCDATPGKLEVSNDDGDTWVTSDMTEIELGEVRQLVAAEDGRSRLVMLDQDCETSFSRSFVGGAAWEPSPDAGGLWYLEETPSETAQTSAGPMELPCSAVSVAGLNGHGAILCEGATVAISIDAGEEWTDPIAAPGAVAIGKVDEDFLVAHRNTIECTGITTSLIVNSEPGEPGGCASDQDFSNEIAIAGRNEDVFVWVGNDFFKSIDGGKTWEE